MWKNRVLILQQEQKRRTSKMSKLQIAVEAPDFVLNDFRGQAVSLNDFRDRKNVLLVFNRGFL